MRSQAGGDKAKVWWAQLTDNELDETRGEYDKLVGLLQSRYGWTREDAEKDVERRKTDRAA
jgi:uncharacterized protein YjbJ (UPF0337 family)